jgi:hypothetical protein
MFPFSWRRTISYKTTILLSAQEIALMSAEGNTFANERRGNSC